MGKQPNSAVEHTKGKTHRVHIPTKRFLYSRHYHPMYTRRYIQNVSIRYNSAFQVNGDRSFDEILPWDHISVGVSRKFLMEEREKAVKGITTPNCREKCSNCGAMAFGGGVCYEHNVQI